MVFRYRWVMMLAFLLALPQLSCGQLRSDSLLDVYREAGHDTTRIRALFDLGNLFIDGPSDSLIHYYSAALQLIDSNLVLLDTRRNAGEKELISRYKHFRFRALLELGIENFFQSNYDKTLGLYEKALAVAEDLEDLNHMSEVYGALGIVNKNRGNYAEALVYYEKALETALQLGDTSWIAACYANAGNVYRRMANYTKALDYFLRAVEVFESLGETRRIAITYMNIGNLYEDQVDLSTALAYYSKALDMSYRTDDLKRIAECLMNIGNIRSAQGEYDSARFYYEKGLSVSIENGFSHVLDDCYKYIGLTYEREGDFDIAGDYYDKALEHATREGDKLTLSEITGYLAQIGLQKKEYKKALDFASRSLDLGIETGDPQLLKNAYLFLSQACEGLGDKAGALRYQKLFANMKDTIFSSEKYKAIKELEMKYETEKKEAQLALLTEKSEVQKLKLDKRNRLLAAIFIILVLVMFIAYFILNNYRLKAHNRAVGLEQRLLRSQMNPHFIFNSLIAIQSFIYKKDPMQAGDYLAKFAELVRMTLDNSRSEFVLLEKEINMLEIYLELQALRFEGKFTHTIEVDSGIDPAILRVPPMLAQPFIENSVEHGLRHKEGKGCICIRFTVENDSLLFSVQDDGIGRDKARELEKEKKHRSMATSITRERLEMLGRRLKKSYPLQITDLKDDSGKASGTLVSFRMPCIGVC